MNNAINQDNQTQTCEMPAQPTVLLASVGGTPAPVIFSIRQHNPDKIVFFASSDSRRIINDSILPALFTATGRIPEHEFIITPDEEDVGASTFELLNRMPEALRKLNVKGVIWPNLIDYTGGTKTMSAAVVWASSRYPCRFSYIGSLTSEHRNKGGLGIVLDGREKCFLIENPWDKVAFFEARAALHLFNRGQYGNAAALIESIHKRIDEPHVQRVITVLGKAFQGYHEWDMFNHKGAQACLGQVQKPLTDLAQMAVPPIGGFRQFAEATLDLFEILKGIKSHELSQNKIWDLLANAWRRAELEGKYEDAAARCYSAIEKAARHVLMKNHGVNPSHATPEKIPDELRAEFIRRHLFKYQDDNGNVSDCLRFGLVDAYRLLYVLGDPLGKRFFARETEILQHLTVRNTSILAHGNSVATKETFETLFDDALHLVDCQRANLTRFPIFPDTD